MTFEAASTLRKLDFFSTLDDEELAVWAPRAVFKRLASGEALFHEGEAVPPALRFVVEGGLNIRKTTANGKETVLRMLRGGEIFGVAMLFVGRQAPGSAIATEPSVVLEIRTEDILATLEQYPALSLKLLVTFAQRLREAQDTVHAVVSERAKTRLARQILLTLERGGGTKVRDGIKLNMKLPHATLSRMVGITYEECVRLLRDWTQEPAILRYERGGGVVVLDRPSLEREVTEAS